MPDALLGAISLRSNVGRVMALKGRCPIEHRNEFPYIWRRDVRPKNNDYYRYARVDYTAVRTDFRPVTDDFRL